MRLIWLVIVSLLSFPEEIEAPDSADEDWGFFGHRRINQLAVFTLPPELIGFYKANIDWITEHAVDPDKRRYATKFEGVRHYIDLDHWGELPFDHIPRNLWQAIFKFGDLQITYEDGRSEPIHVTWTTDEVLFEANGRIEKMDIKTFHELTGKLFYPSENWELPQQKWWPNLNLPNESKVLLVDSFSTFGILPYHLEKMQSKLTNAFRKQDYKMILRVSAELGHYIGDAHVPLHTTTNYNGQLTNQLGIHAFWESRIPELFADEEYDFFVGKADYIESYRPYFWNTILTSHRLVDHVLRIEADLKKELPDDQQFCFDERLGRNVRTQCESFARAYQERMQGMVEKRMQTTIHALGSLWYSAWIDAGQPKLPAQELTTIEEVDEALEKAFRTNKIFGRKHDN